MRFSAAVLALLLAMLPAHADEPPAICAVTESDFMASAARVKAEVRVASPAARNKIISAINKARAGAKLWPFEADKLVIGIIMDNGTLLVGVAMFQDRCVVPGSVKVVPADQWVSFTLGLGISMDDFQKENGA